MYVVINAFLWVDMGSQESEKEEHIRFQEPGFRGAVILEWNADTLLLDALPVDLKLGTFQVVGSLQDKQARISITSVKTLRDAVKPLVMFI